MLSTETPPGSSFPCIKPSLLRADERVSDQLDTHQERESVGLGETQTPKFSIRDYVFTSRNKGITSNWPFPQRFLQLCVKHGVRDLLPPFEPPDSVRARCCRKVEFEDARLVADQPQNIIIPESSLGSDKNIADCLDSVEDRLLENTKPGAHKEGVLVEETAEGNDQIDQIRDRITEHRLVQVDRSVSEVSSELEVVEPRSNISAAEVLLEPSDKKSRIVVKPAAVMEIRSSEEILSTSTVLSDPMASKVCPVCKIFASTSNTTLNAHIDQCLFTESNTERVMTEIQKPRVKPRKKKLMVDIYVTALRCTLEDLDRRNGTNWATPALVTPAINDGTEIKMPKLSPVDTKNHEGDEGAVYVDSNGIKLRILSKFDDTPLMSKDHFKTKKVANAKEGKTSLDTVCRSFETRNMKCMNLKPQTKKFSSFNSFSSEDNDELPPETPNAPEQISSGGSATLRHWACSKRSDLPKKLNNNDIQKLGICRRLSTVRNQSEVCTSYVVGSHVLKLPRPSESLVSSPKKKRVDFLSGTSQFMGDAKKGPRKQVILNSKRPSEGALTDNLMLKKSRSLGASVSSPKNRCDEMDTSTTQRSNDSSDATVRASKNPNAGKMSILKRSALVGSGKASTFKKLRKQISVTRTGEQPSDFDGLHRYTKPFAVDIGRTSKTIRKRRSDLSEGSAKFTNEEIKDQQSPNNLNISGSEEGLTAPKKRKIRILRWRNPGVAGQDLKTTTSNMQADASLDIGTKFSIDEPAGGPVNSDSNSEQHPSRSVEDNVQSMGESENHFEPKAEKQRVQQDMHYCGSVSRDNAASAARETASLQESSACLTSHGDALLGIHEENSSLTSIQLMSDQNQNLGTSRERSGSPVSTASTIAPSPKHQEPKPSTRPAAQNESGSAILPFDTIICVPKPLNRDKSNDNLNGLMTSTKEPDILSGDRSCCCSRKEGLSRDSQQYLASETMPPSKGKQVSCLSIVPSVSSSFRAYPSSKSDLTPFPILESPTESVATKACIDFSSPVPSPRTPSSSNSILRLMGKNLMVPNKEEFTPPTVHPSTDFDPFCSQSLQPPFPSTGLDGFWYYHHHQQQQQQQQLSAGSAFYCHSPSLANQHMALHSAGMRVSGLKSPLQASLKMRLDQQSHNEIIKQPISPSATKIESILSSHQQRQKEVIVIDDSPEFEANPVGNFRAAPFSNQRSFTNCFPSPGQYVSMGYANTAKRGKPSEGPVPLLPRPFGFQSPSTTGHLWPSSYHSQTLR